jgi:hypothetical protein
MQSGYKDYFFKAVKGYATVGAIVAFSILLLGVMGDVGSLIYKLVIALLVCSLIALGVFIYWLYRAISRALPFTIVQSSLKLPVETFSGITFSSVTRNPNECIIVVGSKLDHGPYKKGSMNEDWEAARNLQSKFNLAAIKSDTELNEKERNNNNLILVGGPLVNTITHDVSGYLPISLSSITQGGVNMKGVYSTISGKYYQGREFGIIEVIPNNVNPRKIIIVAFGLNREGTTASVDMLTNNIDELDTMNKYDNKYPAKLIRVTRDDNNKLSSVIEE